MKVRLTALMILLAGIVAAEVRADSTESGGVVTASESKSLGAGPFNHDNPVGTSGSLNSVVNVTFTGGFVANQVRFIGTLNKVASGDYASENDIRVTKGGTSLFNWQNPGVGSSSWGPTYNYDSSQSITGSGAYPGGIDPAGNWTVTFYNSFQDNTGPGLVDSTSTNVTMEFRRIDPLQDSNGVFSAGTLTSGVEYNSVGEFAVAQTAGANGNNDRYNFTLLSDGTLSVETFGTNVFTGNINGDTEIGIFNANTGAIVTGAFDDDSGPGFYGALTNVTLTAGNYTLVIGDYDTNFSNTSTLSNLTFGSATSPYDYGLKMNFTAVPEPSTAGILIVCVGGLLLKRRRAV
ncbi:MAG: DVUA0089 family protein [Planctomycetota bacterium]